MIPKEITEEHILLAINEVDKKGVPPKRESTKFNLIYKSKEYPPKYVVARACFYATGEELKEFSGGEQETNKYLKGLGFNVISKEDWNERECYFAVWGYDQLDIDRTLVKKHLYAELSKLINRTEKSIEWKIQNVSACDSRPRGEKPISEAPNIQKLLRDTFNWFWADRESARQLYSTFYQEAQFNKPSTSTFSPPIPVFIEEGSPGFQESMRRQRSAVLLRKGREYFRRLDPEGKLRCHSCNFTTPEGIESEIVQLHHLIPIAEAGEEGRTLSVEKALELLLPLCPTCHNIAHSSKPPLELKIIQELTLKK